MDDFSSTKAEQAEAMRKADKNHNQSNTKGKKVKNSLSTINETVPGQAHRKDYTQIVSKVMILKKLSNSKSPKYSSSSKSSLESESRENFDNDTYRGTSNSSIMKIVITDRVPECTPPRATPRDLNDLNDSIE